MLTVIELPATATYARRTAVWLRATAGAYPDGRDGTLTLRLSHSRRCGSKLEVDSYAVEEQPWDLPGHRLFLLANLSDRDADEIYEVVIGPIPAQDQCKCTAGRVDWYRCKHRDALRSLIDEGVLAREAVAV